MTTTHSDIYVEVPGHYIKDKDIDFDGEVFSILGGEQLIFGKYMRAPSLGVFSLLETFESPFIADPANCSIFDLLRVVYVNKRRKDCVQLVMNHSYPNRRWQRFVYEDKTTWSELDNEVFAISGDILDYEESDFAADFMRLADLFNLQFNGFEMIPSKGNSGRLFWFGAEMIASMSQALSCSLDELLWDMPLCYVGHYMAAHAQFNGMKGIRRPKDKDDMKLQFDEAKKREAEGKLHPWQIAAPIDNPPTPKQMEVNPGIVAEWELIAKRYKDGKA